MLIDLHDLNQKRHQLYKKVEEFLKIHSEFVTQQHKYFCIFMLMIESRKQEPFDKTSAAKMPANKRKSWLPQEDDILKKAVDIHGSNWRVIAEYFDDRNACQCAQRWSRIKPPKAKTRKLWENEEDEKLKQLCCEYNCNWKIIAQYLPHRTPRQIRERYINHLDPNINDKAWTLREDLKIWKMYQRIGSKWSEMAKTLMGRPENMIKNRFYSYIRQTYGNQQNPYQIIPKTKRSLKSGALEMKEKTQSNEQIFRNDQPQNQIKYIDYQDLWQQEIDFFNQSIGKPINFWQCDSYSKIISESKDIEIKLRQSFQFKSYESNLNYLSHNRSLGKNIPEDDDYDFINQFNSGQQSIPVKIRSDIFEDLTKTWVDQLQN